MNRTERLEALNYACSQALVELRQVAGRIVSGYGSECSPDALLRVFLDSMVENLDFIPDPVAGSCQEMQDYLLESLETNNWQPPKTISDKWEYLGILGIRDLEGSGLEIEGPRGPYPRVFHAGPVQDADEDLVFISRGGFLGKEVVMVPVSVGYVETLAEETPRE